MAERIRHLTESLKTHFNATYSVPTPDASTKSILIVPQDNYQDISNLRIYPQDLHTGLRFLHTAVTNIEAMYATDVSEDFIVQLAAINLLVEEANKIGQETNFFRSSGDSDYEALAELLTQHKQALLMNYQEPVTSFDSSVQKLLYGNFNPKVNVRLQARLGVGIITAYMLYRSISIAEKTTQKTFRLPANESIN